MKLCKKTAQITQHFFFLQKTLLLRKSLYKTFKKSFIKSASQKIASQKTCAKRKTNMFFCQWLGIAEFFF